MKRVSFSSSESLVVKVSADADSVFARSPDSVVTLPETYPEAMQIPPPMKAGASPPYSRLLGTTVAIGVVAVVLGLRTIDTFVELIGEEQALMDVTIRLAKLDISIWLAAVAYAALVAVSIAALLRVALALLRVGRLRLGGGASPRETSPWESTASQCVQTELTPQSCSVALAAPARRPGLYTLRATLSSTAT